MTYGDILVQVDDAEGSRARVAAAASVARRSQAHLTGVFLKSEFLRNYMAGEAVAYLPPDVLDQLLRDHAAGVGKASEAARKLFDEVAREAGVATDWRLIDGDDDAPLTACARRSDLTVLPPVATASLGWRRLAAASIGLASGGPVLVVPEAGAAPTVGERILVAWKDTRESARALHDAWPLILSATEVQVVMVAPDGGGSEESLKRHFERHGCSAGFTVDRSHDASAGDILRRKTLEMGADLVVMGLYGRPRLQELILGGVSVDMLANPPATLFVSH